MGHGPPPLRPARDGQLRGRTGRPGARRTELDHREGLRPVARCDPYNRRAHHRPLRQGALTFTWNIFNEPDLGPLFWRAGWDELQTFYDYTTDAILRVLKTAVTTRTRFSSAASSVGGIFGTNLRLKEFLAHCSPRALAEGASLKNAAFADSRLDGKRSKRVEKLCREHTGKGSPCNFISIHSYNRSELLAAKLIRAKELALEIDQDYYKESVGQFA